MKSKLITILTVAVMMAMATAALAADEGSKANLAQQANNPIANMISVPFQYNANFNIGPYDRTQQVLSIQPVIPFELSEDWLLVSRWVLPVVYQPDVLADSGGTFGIGDFNPAFFFSPSSKLTGLPQELVFGFGPGLQVPTRTDPELGSNIWGLGPTALAVYQMDKWLFGVLVANTWSLGGGDESYNDFLLEPFITYNITDEWYLISDWTITADWNAPSSERWVVPSAEALAGRSISVSRL